MMNFIRNVWPVPIVIIGGIASASLFLFLIGEASDIFGPNRQRPFIEVRP